MARSVPRLAIFCSALALPLSASASPVQLVRPGQSSPRVTVGVLSAARSAPAERIAREHLLLTPRAQGGVGAVELAAPRTHTLGALRVVRFSQTVGGLPVVGGGAAVLLDDAGRVRATTTTLVTHPPAALSPGIAVDDALDAVNRATVHEGTLRPDHAELALLRQGEEGRLVWAVTPPPSMLLRSAPLVLVDARTGAIVRTIERARDARLRVYPSNPVATPMTMDVDVSDLVVATPQHLKSALVDARNCPDRHELTNVSLMGFMLGIHLCTEEAVATPDAMGNFLYDPSMPNAPDDLFAESHMYFHVSGIYAFFKALGFADVNSLPLRSVVNFRIPIDINAGFDIANATNPNGTLFAFDNAFFLPGAGGLIPGVDRNFDSIVFGQGSVVDFAYDGDVISHEFTHAVIGATSRLDMMDLDEQGLDPSTGGMNEAYADYFAAARTGSSAVGEYAATGLPTMGGSIRDVGNMDRCPDALWGEVHQDSLPWSGALWQIRSALGAPADRAILAAVMMLPRDADFDDASMLTIQTLTTAAGGGGGGGGRRGARRPACRRGRCSSSATCSPASAWSTPISRGRSSSAPRRPRPARCRTRPRRCSSTR